MINRRELLNIAATAGVASVLAADSARTAEQESTVIEIVDTNVSLFQWPFRRLPLDDTTALVKKLRSLGIAEAWAGSFDGVLHRDVAGVNQRLAVECKRYPELIPIGSINPELPDWEEDLRRCIETHDMPGIRLHPNYHGYTLDDSRFARLLKLATAKGRFVQIAATMEDVRTQHPLVRAADVDLKPLPDVMTRVRGANVQILNYRPSSPLLEKLAKAPGIHFGTARADGSDAVPKLVERVPNGRVMFGTHAPFLIPEAALIRVHESGQLDEPALRSVLSTNA
ncbi:MAG: amidohydrolase family protein, partial [Planctomycetaceae bacterium]|nr:amidohydrolase family protein [Planctomycetaceae bacterium]